MINIFSPEDAKNFYKYIDMPTKREVRGTREYVVRTHSGALLISFHWLDDSSIVLFANEERCSLMTANELIADRARDIDDEEGNGLHELFAFFLALTATDTIELQQLEDRVEDLEDQLFVDGKNTAPMVFPQRGLDDWKNYGWSNPVKVYLKKGAHKIALRYLTENININIDLDKAHVKSLRLTQLP